MSPKELSVSDGFCFSCSRTSSSRSGERELGIGDYVSYCGTRPTGRDDGGKSGFEGHRRTRRSEFLLANQVLNVLIVLVANVFQKFGVGHQRNRVRNGPGLRVSF